MVRNPSLCSVSVCLAAAQVMNGALGFLFFFPTAAKDSRLFRNLPHDVLHAFATEPLTANFHKWSLSMEVFDPCIPDKRVSFVKTGNKCANNASSPPPPTPLCSLSQNFTKNENLRNFYNVLSTNTDGEVEFISTMEGRAGTRLPES